ncbi:MAG: NADH-quinone oxidoreductase subunit D [Chloroflexi bacterium]|nr:NADH-quinone oxidoreductase subunit D [Chloroflexota bacterium]
MIEPGLQILTAARGEQLDLTVNMGPQHPSTHGVFRMLLQVDGERVVGVEPFIGYLHRGSEKLCEVETYRQIIPLFDRLDYLSAFNNELAFVMAVEKLLGVSVPERAEYIRVILCELNRVASHLMFYGAYGIDTGAMTPFMFGFRERERIQHLFESVSGARMMHNYFRPGGLNMDVPDDFADHLRALLPVLERGLREADQLLSKNEIFLARTRGIGVISAEDAIRWSLSGPMLRASGVAEDVRRSEPYSVYDRFEFAIPVGDQGDCYDRYLVRLLEIEQSLRIIRQAIDQLPSGPVMGNVPKVIRPPAGECYVRCENPRGELGVYLVSTGERRPYRVKVRGPSFVNLSAIQQLLLGSYVADAVVILGSIDIVLGEVDR